MIAADSFSFTAVLLEPGVQEASRIQAKKAFFIIEFYLQRGCNSRECKNCTPLTLHSPH